MNFSVRTIFLLTTTLLFLFQISIAQESFKRGDKILIPVSIGTDDSILGEHFNVNLEKIPEFKEQVEIQRIEENTYRSEFQFLMDGSIKTKALKAISLINISSSQNYQETSALLTAYQIREIRKVETPTQSEALLFASSLYYGWSLNYVLTGNSQDFNAQIAGEFQNLAQSSGINIEQKLSSLNINHKLIARGLEQNGNSVGISINREEVNKNFKEGKPLPIFLELTFLKDYNPSALDWDKISSENKEIGIEEIRFSVSEMKNSSQKWDNTSYPDPILEIYLGEELVMTTDRINDSLNPTFSINASIKYSELSNLTFVLFDYDDFTGNDIIGSSVIATEYLKSENTNNEIELIFDGQILRSVIRFYRPQE